LLAAQVKRITDFIVYTNLFIAACAIALTSETFIILQLPSFINWYLLLLFLCTVFVYSLHYYTKTNKLLNDSRLYWCRNNKKLLLAIIITSALLIAGGVVFHFNAIFMNHGAINYGNIAWFIIIPLLALGYSHPLIPWNKKGLRQVGWLKMIFLSFIWSFTTTVLPVWMLLPANHTHAATTTSAVLFIHRFFFIAALSVLFNINDYEEDKADGVKTIAVLLGPAQTLKSGKWLVLIINTVTSLWMIGCFQFDSIPVFAAILIPVWLLFWSYHRFSTLSDDAIFVMRYDGLMIVKALLLIFALLTFSS
jgi:4-hydroxybenzoate polyprenyltransferase